MRGALAGAGRRQELLRPGGQGEEGQCHQKQWEVSRGFKQSEDMVKFTLSKNHAGCGVENKLKLVGMEAGRWMRNFHSTVLVDQTRVAVVRLERGGQIQGRLDKDWLQIVWWWTKLEG